MADKTKSRDEIRAEMDAAAEGAAKELKKLPKEAVKTVATWLAAHKPGAGYKRLGRLLVGTLPAPKKAESEKPED